MLAFVIVLVLAVATAGAKSPPPVYPFQQTFSENETVANWLLAYDFAAWKATDLVVQEPDEELKKLGPEWFCFQDPEGTWHAVFGRYDAEAKSYVPRFHYVRRDDAMVRSEVAVDPELAVRFGAAINTARARLPKEITDLPVKFNIYVRPVEGDKIDVWFLPAMQQDNTVVFGGDVRYSLDATGTQVLDQRLDYKEFRGVMPDENLDLKIDRQYNEVASVGDILLILQFRRLFKSVTVWTHCYTMRALDQDGEQVAWLHVERDTRECNKFLKKARRESAP